MSGSTYIHEHNNTYVMYGFLLKLPYFVIGCTRIFINNNPHNRNSIKDGYCLDTPYIVILKNIQVDEETRVGGQVIKRDVKHHPII